MYKISALFLFLIFILVVFVMPLNAVLAQVAPQPGPGPVVQPQPGPGMGIPNPLAGAGIGSVNALVKAIIDNIVMPIGSVVIVLMIIFAGFQFVVAQGNMDKIKDAKNTFFFAVIGAAILLGSWTIAQIIQSTVNQVTGKKTSYTEFNHHV